LVKTIDKSQRIKDFANSAMFSVTKLGINWGMDYLRNKDVGANATYAFSAKVENTDWMDFDALSATNTTRRVLAEPVAVIEEDEESDPIYLDLWAMDYDTIYDGVLVLAGRAARKAPDAIVYPQNLTLDEIEVINLFEDSSLLNISYQNDVSKESKTRFQRLKTNVPIEKSGVYKLNVDL